ncbi:NADH-quinone oxidoreductase subunit M [Nocardioides terrae]|uniref:NADH-quinone oxidoreductase subunit M n=1 Tax=Nocardioides terrae TaxID=574651 RepID=A0A1I1HNQ5_9ACTN|nr:NADH-quinone oxidoreductase subunit M [Nocardioides terrae]SFC22650.1 NADH-quinone oxidoreductase subunit M [Nocardioides terrae]
MTLTILCALPLVGALVTALTPAGGGRPKQIALAFSLLALVQGIIVAARFDKDGGSQSTEKVTWIKAFGAHYALGVDGLGLLMVLLTVVLVPIVLVAAWRDTARPSFFAWALALEGFSLVVFTSTDVLLFYVVFEATLIPAYFLIGGFGREGRSWAALKFLMYQLGGGLVLLAGVIGLYVESAGSANGPSYLISDLAQLDLSTNAERWIFVAFFIAFAVKAPLFPLHTWLADTTEKATPATSVLLVCILDKIGTFGMLRFCLGLFPDASQWATPVVVTLALISIVYGAFLAIGQDDLLRLVGLTSLSHFGFITLGIFAFTSQGGSGAILYMVNHGVATAGLFLTVGFLLRRHGTVRISELRGLESVTPVLAGLFLVAGLATLGLPGLSQFVSEILVLISAFDYHWWVGAIAVTGIVLAAVYVLWAYQRVFTGAGVLATGAEHAPVEERTVPRPGRVRRDVAEDGTTSPDPERRLTRRDGPTTDLDRREVGVLAPLVLALVFFGFVPGPLLDLANPTVSALMEHAGVTDDAPVVAEGSAH